jgi:hypothetical protein
MPNLHGNVPKSASGSFRKYVQGVLAWFPLSTAISGTARTDTSIPVAVRANLPAITAGGLRRRTGLEVKVSCPGIHKLWVRTD